jgi:hypothetical protein
MYLQFYYPTFVSDFKAPKIRKTIDTPKQLDQQIVLSTVTAPSPSS